MTEELIKKVLGKSNNSAKSYPSALPPELSKWLCYLRDNGHSILCLHERNKVQAFEDESAITDFMLPIPVKTVLRKYAVKDNFVIVDVEYSSEIGLIIPDEDKEF
ncbi:MAG: hypothetical protein AAB336_09810 [Acidobacteriota bacterium]